LWEAHESHYSTRTAAVKLITLFRKFADLLVSLFLQLLYQRQGNGCVWFQAGCGPTKEFPCRIPRKMVESKEKGGIKDMTEKQDRDKRVEKLLEELIGEATEVVEQPDPSLEHFTSGDMTLEAFREWEKQRKAHLLAMKGKLEEVKRLLKKRG